MFVIKKRIYEDDCITVTFESTSEILEADVEILGHFIIFKSMGENEPRWILPTLFRLKKDICDNMGELSFLDSIVYMRYDI